MATVTTAPEFGAPNRPLRLTFNLSESTANFVRVWVTNAPLSSGLRGKLDESTQNRVEVFTGGGGSEWEFTFDKGGAYTFVAQEYLLGGAPHYHGGYQGSLAGAPSEQKEGSETTITLYVGQRVTQTCGTTQDAATLVLWCWNDTIKPTTLATHGEKSPALTDATSDRALAAVEDATVRTKLDALANVVATAAIGTLSSIVSDFRGKLATHFAHGGFHHDPDSPNADAYLVEYASAPTASELQTSVNQVLKLLRQHMLNDSGDGSGVGADDTHRSGGINVGDFTNAPLVLSVGSLGEAYAALADIHRAYEAHRLSATVHTTPDTINALAALPPLLQLHSAFLAALAALAPAVPATAQTAVVRLVQQAGFTET